MGLYAGSFLNFVVCFTYNETCFLGPSRRFRRIVEHMQKLIAERPVVLDSSTIVNFSDSKQQHPSRQTNGCGSGEEVEMAVGQVTQSCTDTQTQQRQLDTFCNRHARHSSQATKSASASPQSPSAEAAVEFLTQKSCSAVSTSPTAKNKCRSCKCSSAAAAKTGANNPTCASSSTCCDAVTTSCLMRIHSECPNNNNNSVDAAALDKSSTLPLSEKGEETSNNNKNHTHLHAHCDGNLRISKATSPSSPELPPEIITTPAGAAESTRVSPPNFLPFLDFTDNEGSQQQQKQNLINLCNQNEIQGSSDNQFDSDGASINLPSKNAERRDRGHRRCTSDEVKSTCVNGFDLDFDNNNSSTAAVIEEGQYV